MDVVWELGRGVRARGDGRASTRARAQAARVHDLHDDPRPAHAKGLLTRRREGKTDVYRPVHTRDEYADLRAQAEVARSSTSSATSRSATSPARWPSSTPSAARPSSASPVNADARRRAADDSWRVYRLQLALGAAGLAASALVLGGRRQRGARRACGGPSPRRGRGARSPILRSTSAAVRAAGARGARRRRPASSRCAPCGASSAPTAGSCARCPVIGPLPGHPTVARDRRRRAAGVLRRLAAPARVRLDRGPRPSLERELRAVLAHEQHHGALRDPLRLAVGRVLCQALFFLPVLRPLHDRYADVAEMTADAAALDAIDGAAAPLASAMLAVGRRRRGRGGRHLPRARRLPARAAARLAAAAPAADRRAGDARRARRARRGGPSGHASVHASLNLPLVSSQPCVLVLALVPVLACLGGTLARRTAPSMPAGG